MSQTDILRWIVYLAGVIAAQASQCLNSGFIPSV